MGNILCDWNFPRWWLFTVYLFLNLSLIFRLVAVSVKNLFRYLCAYNNVRSTEWVFMKFKLEYFTKNCWEIYFDFHKVREFWLWLHIQTQIYFWIQEYLHLCSSCVFICHIFCMDVHIHAVPVCIFPVMLECSTFVEITGNYKLFGTPYSQKSHCAIVVTICVLQVEQHG